MNYCPTAAEIEAWPLVFVKLFDDDTGGPRFGLEAAGFHTSVVSFERKAGIPHCLKHEVDALLLGSGSKKYLKMLMTKHQASDIIYRLLPTETQLKNRNAYVRKTKEGKHLFVSAAKFARSTMLFVLM